MSFFENEITDLKNFLKPYLSEDKLNQIIIGLQLYTRLAEFSDGIIKGMVHVMPEEKYLEMQKEIEDLKKEYRRTEREHKRVLTEKFQVIDENYKLKEDLIQLKKKVKHHIEVRAGETVYQVWRRELLEMLN